VTAMLSLTVPMMVPLAACGGGQDPAAFSPMYLGVGTEPLDESLVAVEVAMQGARDGRDVEAYAECAAARYALDRGDGFARHIRTLVTQSAGIWEADAVYTLSPTLPEGLRTIDAEVTVANCARNGIPVV